MFPLGTIFAAEKRHKPQSRYNREFPTWFFNFGPYGQLRPVKEKSSIMDFILKYGFCKKLLWYK